MICTYCEEKITDPYAPDVVGGHGEWAHRRCLERVKQREALRESHRREEQSQRELVILRRRVRELERRLAAVCSRPGLEQTRDPHDVDGDDGLECPNKGRLVSHHLSRNR